MEGAKKLPFGNFESKKMRLEKQSKCAKWCQEAAKKLQKEKNRTTRPHATQVTCLRLRTASSSSNLAVSDCSSYAISGSPPNIVLAQTAPCGGYGWNMQRGIDCWVGAVQNI